MSTLVMVKRENELCMAAETLTSFGSQKQSARYVARPEKIFQAGHSFVGIVGWSVTQTVLQSAFAHGCALPEIHDEMQLFEFARVLHRKLKDEYFLNADADEDVPFESSALTAFVMNRFGLFGLYSMRTVEQCERFAAVGSGSEFALGAMHTAWELGCTAEEIARRGVEAGIEFDHHSSGPITLKRMKLEA